MGLASVLQPAVFLIKSRIKINFKIFDMKTLVSSLSKQYNKKSVSTFVRFPTLVATLKLKN
jgi:hypothetical protein